MPSSDRPGRHGFILVSPDTVSITHILVCISQFPVSLHLHFSVRPSTGIFNPINLVLLKVVVSPHSHGVKSTNVNSSFSSIHHHGLPPPSCSSRPPSASPSSSPLLMSPEELAVWIGELGAEGCRPGSSPLCCAPSDSLHLCVQTCLISRCCCCYL